MKPTIEYSDFEKLELRVGRITAAIAPEWSRKLLQFTVDFGPEFGERTVLSGIRQWYESAEFIDNNYLFVINLAERQMGEGVSQGMMLMADTDKAVPFQLPADLSPGTLVR